MQYANAVRIFRDLWLPDPEQALPEHELLHVKALLSLIQRFEVQLTEEGGRARNQPSSPEWNMDKAYDYLRMKEVAWWNERGVTRPTEYLVRPSGQLSAAVACHLYNPTFSVDEPHCQRTEDLSNPSIAQLHRAGFSTANNCIIFDHLARRDVSQHCKDLYPEDLFDIHEEFLFGLRAAMDAKVEICWGANVRQRMLKKLNLVSFRLWGDFAGLSLYLKLTPDKAAMKRFIIFVSHPQRFFYVQSGGERARGWRRRFGIPQDRALLVAARLGGIQITQNFYELDPRLIQNLCVPRELSNQRNTWKGQAAVQLKQAFPSAIISTEKAHCIRSSIGDKAALQKVFDHLEKLTPSQVSDSANLEKDIDDTHLRNLRLHKIARYWDELGELLSEFVPDIADAARSRQRLDARTISTLFEQISAEFQESDCWDWEDLPDPVVEFIQAQDGLKFNKKEISCRSRLELAFHLLQHCMGDPTTLDILTLAIWILIAYGWMITRPRKPTVDHLLILRDFPNDVVARRCSACDKECLDDPFAYWSKSDPSCYVFWYHRDTSCGRPDCKAQKVNLLPLDRRTKYTSSTQKTLEKRSLNKFSKWFLLRPEEFEGLPTELEVKCQGADCNETRIVEARWTVHTTPRFVIAVHKCAKNHKRTNWIPTGYPTINSANLSRLWGQFQETSGFDVTSYPRRPDIYFDNNLSITGRIAALIEAQKLMQGNTETHRKRRASQMGDT